MATTKRRSQITRLGALALALTLVSACLLGGTMAKYTSTVTGTASAPVAKWSFNANGSEGTSSMATPINLFDTATTFSNVTANKLAPGTSGSFDIEVDGSGSEVAIDYVINLTNIQYKPTNLKFYTDAEHSTEFDFDTGLTGTIPLPSGDEGQTVSKTIYWDWAYETGYEQGDEHQTFTVSDTKINFINASVSSETTYLDSTDTTDGKNAATMTLTVEVTGTQAAPVSNQVEEEPPPLI